MTQAIRRGLLAAGALTMVGAANAATDAGVTAAITSAGTDGLAYVGALAVAVAGFVLIKKVLGKLGII